MESVETLSSILGHMIQYTLKTKTSCLLKDLRPSASPRSDAAVCLGHSRADVIDMPCAEDAVLCCCVVLACLLASGLGAVVQIQTSGSRCDAAGKLHFATSQVSGSLP